MKDEKKGALIITGVVVAYLVCLSAALGAVLDNMKNGKNKRKKK